MSDPVASAKQLRVLCATLTRVARQDLETRLGRSEVDIRALEHAVLRHVERGTATLAEISRAMMAAPSTLVSVIDDLERKAFLRRGTDPTDRRRHPLELTPQGKMTLGALPDIAQDSALVKGLAKLSEAEREQLIGTLTGLAHDLTDDDSLLSWLAPQQGLEKGGQK